MMIKSIKSDNYNDNSKLQVIINAIDENKVINKKHIVKINQIYLIK